MPKAVADVAMRRTDATSPFAWMTVILSPSKSRRPWQNIETARSCRFTSARIGQAFAKLSSTRPIYSKTDTSGFCCVQQPLDVDMSQIGGFEERNGPFAKFIVGIRFERLNFGKMNGSKVIDHAHYMLLFRNSRETKIVFHLLNPELDRDLTSAFVFGYTAWYGKASRPTPMSRTMPSPVAVSRAMPRAMSRTISRVLARSMRSMRIMRMLRNIRNATRLRARPG